MGGPWRTETYRQLATPLAEVLGASTAKALAPLKLATVADLMGHLPRRYLSGTETTELSGLEPGENVAVVAQVAEMNAYPSHTRNGRGRLEVKLSDGSGRLRATFFGKDHYVEYWQAQLSKGVKGIFVGKIGIFKNALQMSHPNFVMLDARGNIVGRADQAKASMANQVSRSGLVGIYPATSKMPTWQISECTDLVLNLLAGVDDPMPPELRSRVGLPELIEAYRSIHRPESIDDAEQGIDRLKFDEALALQVTMAYRRADAANHAAPAMKPVEDGLLAAFDRRLPFTLTKGQEAVCQQIFADLTRTRPMQRLLQGEVGSGKTVVALRAMLTVVDNGRQAVLLAPTEVLAGQHFDSLRALMGDLGTGQTLGAPEDATEIVLLTGSQSAAQRRATLDAIADGRAGIVIGTHALLSDTVSFADLGMIVVDEQHRFGVEQRAVLQGRAELMPHLLVMTATPIPRSIAMTVFGDLEVSTLREIPAGRQDVQTTVVHAQLRPAWLDRAWQRVREEVLDGRQVFIVCPRISGSEDAIPSGLPDPSVTELYAYLEDGPLAGLRLGQLHGRLPSSEKDSVMTAFADGQLDVLVATTVIEVGVDVPNASMMIIMDADHFGISQLHQLRGRVGRGAHSGVCLLVTYTDGTSPADERLAAVAATRDGFELAEVDLEQRREGDVLGAAQAGGRTTLRLLRVLDDAELLAESRAIAEQLVAGDPHKTNDWMADMVTETELRANADFLERS